MANLTYNPGVFRVPDLTAAKAIILTPEGGQSTDERWVKETPYLSDLLGGTLAVGPNDLFVDFGCGVGRMAKALIEQYGCRVLGVDFSQDMRALAPVYVDSGRFSVVSGDVFADMVDHGLRVDGAISVWVLQHCLEVAKEVALLHRAMRPGGRLGVVNTLGRVVPTLEKAWASDGVDVRALLAETFTTVVEDQLDEAVVGDRIAHGSFWGAYAKAA
jgi:SAM-dependent methyltransferase